MLRPKQTATGFLSATLIVLASCQLSAFEQSTYFIYQIVQKSDAPAINKRLVLDSKLFIEAEQAVAKSEPEPVERSEFEMDYNSFGTTGSSSFEGAQSTGTATPTTGESSMFDLGTKETISLFGN